MFQQMIEMDMEMEELQKNLMRTSKCESKGMKQEISNTTQVVENTYEGTIEQQHNRIWDPREVQETAKKQKCNQASGKQKHKVWDQRGLKHIEIPMARRPSNFCTSGV